MADTQLVLEVDPPRASPNAAWFHPDGSPRRLLWCSDAARMGGPCPYRPSPADCCKGRRADPD